jgi:HK97 family phage major capsid protein
VALSALAKLENRAAAILAEQQELVKKREAEGRQAFTEDENKDFDALDKEAGDLDKQIVRERKIADRERALATSASGRQTDQNQLTPQQRMDLGMQKTPAELAAERSTERRGMPDVLRRSGQLRNFTPDNAGGSVQEAERRAFASGMWILAVLGSRQPDNRAVAWCKEYGAQHGVQLIQERAAQQAENINTSGGFLVPDLLSNVIIVLREKYGVFRRECKMWPMGSDTLTVPRRTAGTTAYFVNENTAVTQSNKTWDGVSIVAKKLAQLVLYPTELAEDAVINIADDLADELAYQFALKEDQCGFTGDGTSTYGGITGAVNQFSKSGSTSTFGVFTATGHTTWATLTLSDCNLTTGLLPQYAAPNAKWYMHRTAFCSFAERLAYAGGGNTTLTIGGGFGLSFLGYPVVITQVMDSAGTTGLYTALFGDMRLAAAMGDRRGITIKASDQRFFDSDQLALLGTERFDINVHDTGSATVAGPIVALKIG